MAKEKKVAIRPTHEDYEQRVAYAEFLLSRRLYKCDIKRLLFKKFNVCARSSETYLSRARANLRDKTGKTRAEHQIESMQFYESVLVGPDSTLGERMVAQSRIDRLLGLEDGLTSGASTAGPVLNIIEQVVSTREEAASGLSPVESETKDCAVPPGSDGVLE